MNRISLLLATMVVLSGCQSMGPEPLSNTRSIYTGDNSLLYQVKKQASSPEQAMQIAAMAYRAGDLDQALYQYLRALELDPERYAALVWVGRIHRERGNNQLAEMAFAEVLGKDAENLAALTEMGLLQLALRRQEKAAQILTAAVAIDQKRFASEALQVDSQSPLKLYNGMGVLADLRNDFAAAALYYGLSLRIDPGSALAHNSLAYSQYLAGDWSGAERQYRRGIDLAPNYKPLWRNYGLLLARSERYEEALSAFEQVGSRAEASNDVGYVCLIEGRLDIAEQFFHSAIEQSPAHYALAWDNLRRVEQIRKIRLQSGQALPVDVVAGVPGEPQAMP